MGGEELNIGGESLPNGGELERMLVLIRLRPLNEKELYRNDVSDWECINKNTIIYKSSYPTAYSFDRVFGNDCTARQVYEEGAKDVALAVVSGINSTIFAYGQTSSGKTYTMSGITDYAVRDIYDYIERHSERDFVLKFSAIEIYNEAVRDLLSQDPSPLRLLDDPERGTVVERLTEETLEDMDHFQELLAICEAQRAIGETSLNETSSRSHQILRLTIESAARQFLGAGKSSTLTATVNFVDLAGSERASQTHSAGSRLKEGSHINRSLLTLGTVVRKLSKGRNQHIPFRDSKLTRILQNSLGGNAKTAIICTMSPARSHVEQSRNTLLFATCAKDVSTNAKVNVVMSDKALVKQLQRELARLEGEMKGMGPANAKSNSAALLKEKEQLIQKLMKDIQDLTQQRDIAQSRIDRLLQSNREDQVSMSDQCSTIGTSEAASPRSDFGHRQYNLFKNFSRYEEDDADPQSFRRLSEYPEDSFLLNEVTPKCIQLDPREIWEQGAMDNGEVSETSCKEVQCIEVQNPSFNKEIEPPCSEVQDSGSINKTQPQDIEVQDTGLIKGTKPQSDEVQDSGLIKQTEPECIAVEDSSLIKKTELQSVAVETEPRSIEAQESSLIKKTEPQSVEVETEPRTIEAQDSSLIEKTESQCTKVPDSSLIEKTKSQCSKVQESGTESQCTQAQDSGLTKKIEAGFDPEEKTVDLAATKETVSSPKESKEMNDILNSPAYIAMQEKIQELQRTIDYLVNALYNLERSPCSTEDTNSSCNSIKFNRSLSCKAVLMSTSTMENSEDNDEKEPTSVYSPNARTLTRQYSELSTGTAYSADEENENANSPLHHKADRGVEKQFVARRRNSDTTIQPLSRKDSPTYSSSISRASESNKESRTEQVEAAHDLLSEMEKRLSQKQQDDNLVQPVQRATPPSAEKVKEASLEKTQNALQPVSDWPAEFERKRRQIFELWNACHVPLVHRTYFFLLFQGDQADSVYLEVEIRRLSFLKGGKGVNLITPGSSSKDLLRERDMLSRQIHHKFHRKEREDLYQKWNISLSTKQRSVQLAKKIWTDTKDLNHINESAALVAKLVGFIQPGQAPKEIFGLSFLPRSSTSRRSYSWSIHL